MEPRVMLWGLESVDVVRVVVGVTRHRPSLSEELEKRFAVLVRFQLFDA